MTTITTATNHLLELEVTLTTEFHHGAGSAGNTSLLRTQEVIDQNGHVHNVPFLSAASVRHMLRTAIAWHIAKTLNIQPGSLHKETVDLLWTGGAVSSTGAKTDLDLLRRVDNLLPHLRLFGYCAKNSMVPGTLIASDWVLECSENAFRLPIEESSLMPAAAFRGEKFGTRHDQATSPAGQFIQLAAGDTTESTQMIWDTQVLLPGSQLYGSLELTPAGTETHFLWLQAALLLAAPGGQMTIGAKSGQGYGRALLGFCDTSEELNGGVIEAVTSHLETHAQEICDLLEELAQ